MGTPGPFKNQIFNDQQSDTKQFKFQILTPFAIF